MATSAPNTPATEVNATRKHTRIEVSMDANGTAPSPPLNMTRILSLDQFHAQDHVCVAAAARGSSFGFLNPASSPSRYGGGAIGRHVTAVLSLNCAHPHGP